MDWNMGVSAGTLIFYNGCRIWVPVQPCHTSKPQSQLDQSKIPANGAEGTVGERGTG